MIMVGNTHTIHAFYAHTTYTSHTHARTHGHALFKQNIVLSYTLFIKQLFQFYRECKWLLPLIISWLSDGTSRHFGRNEGQTPGVIVTRSAGDVTLGDLVVVLLMSVVNSVGVPVAMGVVS